MDRACMECRAGNSTQKHNVESQIQAHIQENIQDKGIATESEKMILGFQESKTKKRKCQIGIV